MNVVKRIKLRIEVINMFTVEEYKTEYGADCWGRIEYEDVYDVYCDGRFVCRMMDDPTILVDKINNILSKQSPTNISNEFQKTEAK